MIKIKAIDHIVLRSDDDKALIAFYIDVLGCQLERQLPELGLSQLRAGNSLIDIVGVDSQLGKAGGHGPRAQGRNLDHFCLTIEATEQQALIDYLDSHQVPHGDFTRRYGSEGYGQSIYIEDPDHNSVELKLP